MPIEWQKKFTDLLEDLEESTSDLKDLPSSFWIRAKEENKFISDPYINYERGRRLVKLKQ